MEHSLVSLSKWESKWCKPFFSRHEKTDEEMIDYIKCMTLTKNVKDDIYYRLTEYNVEQIKNYIDAPMTATRFSDDKGGKSSSEGITSELIYYWMIALNIPFDPCQKWHINRLLTLVKICSKKNQPEKKRSARDTMSRNKSLNAARRKQLKTRG